MEALKYKKCYPSVEEVLGPKEKRYCSFGFKSVNFSFTDFQIGDKFLTAKIQIDFSKKWSSKNDQSLKPHLGTTEYFNISVILSELLLKNYFEIDKLSISKSWVSFLKVKAGSIGDNNIIQDVKVSYIKILSRDLNYGESTFNVCIGHMMIQLTIVHPIDQPRTPIPYPDYSIFINYIEHHFFKKGYKESETDIRNVALNLPAHSLQSDIVYKNCKNKYFGIASFYQTMNIANFILLSGQLMQILLYELEGITRDQSKNMWLRSLEINFPKPISFIDTKVQVSCETFKTLMLKNNTWRVADILISMDTLLAKFNMTHQIVKI